jgi:hypothetical protein
VNSDLDNASRQASRSASPPKRLALYFVSTPFHYLSAGALKVSGQLEADFHHLLYTRKEVAHHVDSTPILEMWDAVNYLPWPRLDPLPGLLGRHRRLLDNLELILKWCDGYDEVIILADQIVSEPVNFSIGAIARSGIKVRVRLLPDGYMNFHRVPIPKLEQFGQLFRKLRRLSSARLHYTLVSGDRTGIDHPIVEGIYLFEGSPHAYPVEKVRSLPSLCSLLPHATKRDLDRVLILGHAHRFKPDLAQRYTNGIAQLLNELEIEPHQVDYKGHPKCPRDDLWDKRYCEINPPEVIELYLLRHHYRAVIAIISSTLFNIQLSQGESQRCIALGPNLIQYRHAGEYATARKTLDSLEIEVIEL